MSNTGPESSAPPAGSGGGGAGLRPAGAGAGQRFETRLLIRGEQVAGAGRQLVVENPYTESELASVRLPAQSGVGRELGQEGLEAFQETKHVHLETSLAPKDWWYPYGSGH